MAVSWGSLASTRWEGQRERAVLGVSPTSGVSPASTDQPGVAAPSGRKASGAPPEFDQLRQPYALEGDPDEIPIGESGRLNDGLQIGVVTLGEKALDGDDDFSSGVAFLQVTQRLCGVR